MLCPCQSQTEYKNCCQPFHLNKAKASTAEKLMRSRYSAYALKLADYILDTQNNTTNQQSEVESILQFANQVNFMRLQILSSELGTEQDNEGKVEFKAWYLDKDKNFHWMHETSSFERIQGTWLYLDGELDTNPMPIKLGRNDICLCGSGKKFKKCCSMN